MIANILLSYLFQVLSTIGVITIFGFLIGLINRLFYRNFGNASRTVCYLTGFIGTPVHELSHALMCIIFCHRINEIKLFQINDEDGTLGYVIHSYNKRNIYQNIGNFFIGVAPIIVMSLLMFGFSYLLVPDLSSAIIVKTSFSISNLFEQLAVIARVVIGYLSTWQFWVFVLISSLFSLHMTLSKEDIKGSLSGLVLLLVVILIVDFILGFIGELDTFNKVTLLISTYFILFMCISLLISIILLLISFVIRLIFRRRL